MYCTRTKKQLQDYIDGSLSGDEARDMINHLTDCHECHIESELLKNEKEMLARYYADTSFAPPRNMWGLIMDQLHEEQGMSSRFNWKKYFNSFFSISIGQYAAYAAVLMVIGFASVALYLWDDESKSSYKHHIVQKPSLAALVDEAPLAANVEVSPKPRYKRQANVESKESIFNKQIIRAEIEYVKAIKELDRAIAQRKDLDHSIIQQYKQSLSLIDSNILATRQAMYKSPNDLSTAQLLLSSYEKKRELMQDLVMN